MSAAEPSWRGVDAGWGHAAVDVASLHEPASCREYVALHHHLRVGPGDRLLDVAALRGAACAGLDASARLLAIARDRSPAADLRVGDMHELPWQDGCFDVVTSFRGIWGTTPAALAEVHRVLAPGGRLVVGIRDGSVMEQVTPDLFTLRTPDVLAQALTDARFDAVQIVTAPDGRSHLLTATSPPG